MLFDYLGYRSAKDLTSKINKAAYLESDLVEIKVKLNLPYYTSKSNYETFKGEITIGENHYSYVKRKVSEDTLYLKCLRNQQKDELQVAKADYEQATNEFGTETNGKETFKKENSFAKYLFTKTAYQFTALHEDFIRQYDLFALNIPAVFIAIDEMPPESGC